MIKEIIISHPNEKDNMIIIAMIKDHIIINIIVTIEEIKRIIVLTMIKVNQIIIEEDTSEEVDQGVVV
jgi:hypothetical protein